MRSTIRSGILAAFLGTFLLVSGCTPQQVGGAGGGVDWVLIGSMVVVFAGFYFLMIRPQRRKQKEQESMLTGLKKGDKIITAGGIYGVIDAMSEDAVVIRVESGATLRIVKNSIAVKRPG